MLVDTLVAVVVISLVLSVCLITVRIASATARNAQDATEARMLLSGLMESTPRTSGIYSGTTGTMAYSVAVTEIELNSVRLCRLDASVRPKSKHRAYRLTGTRWCAPVST